jgi:predicted site-specific integrase-resolvase
LGTIVVEVAVGDMSVGDLSGRIVVYVRVSSHEQRILGRRPSV